MTGRELAQRILALPEDQQSLEVYQNDTEGLRAFAGQLAETDTITYGPDDNYAGHIYVDYYPESSLDEGDTRKKVLVIR